MFNLPVAKSAWIGVIATGTVLFSAALAPAGARQYERSLYDCVDAARELGGADYRKVDRRVQQNASVFEYWVSSAADKSAPRIYCRVNIRVGQIERIAQLPDGAYRP